VTIADYVADLRAATPSNAAELAVPDAAELRESIVSAGIRSAQAMRKKLGELAGRLESLAGRRVIESPLGYVEQKRMELELMHSRAATAAERSMKGRENEIARLGAALEALSPLKVLSRGYSIATDDRGRVLRDAASLEAGDRVEVILAKGRLHCAVEGIE
jgi:exodeoxyribonuclease VII large subunit